VGEGWLDRAECDGTMLAGPMPLDNDFVPKAFVGCDYLEAISRMVSSRIPLARNQSCTVLRPMVRRAHRAGEPDLRQEELAAARRIQ
jgi:hypothetical protein